MISLINSIVGGEDQVKEVRLLNPYNPKNFKKDKLSILDIKAKGIDGKRFNIEIQISNEADYDKRALYYWAKLLGKVLYRTASSQRRLFESLSKAIGIHILNFTSIPSVKKYHNIFHVKEKESCFLYFKDLELHTLELKKFSENPQEELSDVVAKIKSALDIWMAFLTWYDLLNKDHLPPELDNEELKKGLSVLDVMNFGEGKKEKFMKDTSSGLGSKLIRSKNMKLKDLKKEE